VYCAAAPGCRSVWYRPRHEPGEAGPIRCVWPRWRPSWGALGGSGDREGQAGEAMARFTSGQVSTLRSAAKARAVWHLTAPRLIPITEAI
jgi:hypothetical protein